MPSEEQIHWAEGLFLKPHHLQRMQRNFLEGFASERRLAIPYSYGVIDAEVSAASLSNKIVRFDRLRAVMPSGIEINIPANTELQELPIQRRFDMNSESFLISVGVPLWQEKRANVRDDEKGTMGRPLYSVVSRMLTDENSGDTAHPIEFRRINARLLMDEDDRSGLECMPVLRVMHSGRQGVDVPAEDPSYIPPTLLLHGSRSLRGRVDALKNRIETERTERVRQLQAVGFSADKMRVDQFEAILKLRTLNRSAGRLRPLLEAPGTTPLDVYLELRDVVSELAALFPGRDPWAIADYDHDNLALAFGELESSIPPLLGGGERLAESVDFEAEGNLLVARLTNEQASAPIEYYLAVKSDRDPDAIRRIAEDSVKFRVDSHKKLTQPVVGFGLTLHFEYAPPGLPAPNDLHYFKLQRFANTNSQAAWARVIDDLSVALKFPRAEAAMFQKFTLYMIYAEGKVRP